jgi:hypothetical protein
LPDKFPQLEWVENNHSLTFKLLETLKEHDDIRKAIWPGKNEHIPQNKKGRTKTKHYQDLALRLLKDDPEIGPWIETDKWRVHYGEMMKNRMTKMPKIFNEQKEILGITGGGPLREEDIWDESHLKSKWERVKDICPWFFEMTQLAGNRFDAVKGAISNSAGEVDIDLMTRSRKRVISISPSDDELSPDAEVQQDAESDGKGRSWMPIEINGSDAANGDGDWNANDADGEDDSGAEGDSESKTVPKASIFDDEYINAVLEDDYTPSFLEPSGQQHRSKKSSGKQKAQTMIESAQPSPDTSAPVSRTQTPKPNTTKKSASKRTRGPPKGYNVDFEDKIQEGIEKRNESKRDYRLAQEQTKQLEIREKYRFEQRKLEWERELADRKMMMEEKREKRLEMMMEQQGAMMVPTDSGLPPTMGMNVWQTQYPGVGPSGL